MDLESAFRANKIPFEFDALAIRMANGEYRSSEFVHDGGDEATTCKIEIYDEKQFAVYYAPCRPTIEVLNDLAENVYKTLRDESGNRVGKYNDAARTWLFPIRWYKDFVERFQRNITDKNLKLTKLDSTLEKVLNSAKSLKEPVKLDVPDDIVDKMYPFQREGVEHGVRLNGRILIADEMGLGKTVQAIVLAYHYRQDWPLLIVSPSSVKFNWLVELTNWLPMLDEGRIVALYTGKDVKDINKKVQVVITGYQMLDKVANRIEQVKAERIEKELSSNRDLGFGTIILDESHYIKSDIKTCQRAKHAIKLCHAAKRVILLSGTPALGRPIELYNQISVLDKSIFPNRHKFGQRYCEAQKQQWGWVYKGASNMQELKMIMNMTIMIRRKKSEVLTQLPPKIRKIIHVQLPKLKPHEKKQNEQMAAYFENVKEIPSNMQQVSAEDQEWMEGDTEATITVKNQLNKWIQATGIHKVAPISDYITDKLKDENEKLIIFAHHHIVMDALENYLKEEKKGKKKVKYIRIDGKTKAEHRTFFVHDFQNNPEVRVALVSSFLKFVFWII